MTIESTNDNNSTNTAITYSECYAQVFLGDCLELYKNIEPKSIDLILTDLPYGTTQNKWDSIIPFDKLWEMVNYLLKDNGTFITTASEPFASYLRLSNIQKYKYDWYWIKNKKTGFLNANKMPMMQVENVCVFTSKIGNTYNPIKELRTTQKAGNKKYGNTPNYGKQDAEYIDNQSDFILPANVLSVKTERGLHPTQKPVALFEYLLKTYSNEKMTIFDPCMGSGTTGVACKNLNRSFIGIEKDEAYFKIAEQRINARTLFS